jgi:hypothetical protein
VVEAGEGDLRAVAVAAGDDLAGTASPSQPVLPTWTPRSKGASPPNTPQAAKKMWPAFHDHDIVVSLSGAAGW